MKYTCMLLGSGPSYPIPTALGSWGDCDSSNSKNVRTRSSALLNINGANILIDATPDIYAQIVREKISHIDAVIITHIHYDHTAGLGDVFFILREQGRRIPLYSDTSTIGRLQTMFPFAFHNEKPGSFLPNIIAYGGQDVLGVEVRFFRQNHGAIPSLGVRIGDLAYSVDALELDQKCFDVLHGVKTWVVPARGMANTSGHAGLDRALSWVQQVQPQDAILNNLGLEMDYDAISKIMPSNIRLGYDGLVIDGEL